MFLQESKEILVLVVFVGADINDELHPVRNDVMLRTRMDHGDRCLRLPQQWTHLAELILTQPPQVVQCLVDGIYTLVTGSMTALPMRNTVNDHQSFLSDGRLHPRRLAHDGGINHRQVGEYGRETVLTAHLLLTGGDINEIIRKIFLLRQDAVCLQQTDQSATAVVTAQSVEFTIFDGWCKRVPCPCRHRFHRVDVCVQQQSGFLLTESFRHHQVVADTLTGESPHFNLLLQDVSSSLLVSADRGGTDEPAQQFHRFVCIFLVCHIFCKDTKNNDTSLSFFSFLHLNFSFLISHFSFNLVSLHLINNIGLCR